MIRELPPLPAASALAYHQALATLTEDVARDLEGRAELRALIGPDVLDLMQGNHRYHAAFMDSVFFLGDYHLLARTIPWAYRVMTSRGFPLDYFLVGLAAWREAIGRRIPAPLAEPLMAVYSWMIRHHPTFSSEASDLDGSRARWEVDLDPLLDALLEGDLKAAERQVQALLGPAPDLEPFYLRILAPAMHEIGLRWETARISTAQEHLASALVTRLMSAAYARTTPEPCPGKRALVCCAPNELHTIGAWMVADLLELDGWDVRFLGGDLPGADILGLVADFRPRLFMLSISMPFNLRAGAGLIEQIRGCPAGSGLRIMVGGQVFRADPGLAKAIGADGFAPDARAAALLAESWWEALAHGQ
jgi:methanogenic corrinoid protein MtbC1